MKWSSSLIRLNFLGDKSSSKSRFLDRERVEQILSRTSEGSLLPRRWWRWLIGYFHFVLFGFIARNENQTRRSIDYREDRKLVILPDIWADQCRSSEDRSSLGIVDLSHVFIVDRQDEISRFQTRTDRWIGNRTDTTSIDTGIGCRIHVETELIEVLRDSYFVFKMNRQRNHILT